MALGESPPGDGGQRYCWDDSVQPSPETLRLWSDVAAGIDKSQTVVWKSAVESLDSAYRHLNTCEEARRFVEGYMRSVISILLEQQPAKIGQVERRCVEDSLERAILIVAEDIHIQIRRKGVCQVLDVLALVFNRKKTYYKGSKVNWSANLSGLPEVRMQMIESFRALRGFTRLAEYLSARVSTPHFPSLELLHQILSALGESVPARALSMDQGVNAQEMEQDAILVAQAVMDFISNASDESLKKLVHETLNTVRYDLQRIFDRLVSSRRKKTYNFYEFWRGLTLKLITSQSLPLKLFGWDQVSDLIEASGEHRPPPKSFVVSDAGCPVANGLYRFASATTPEGYVQQGVEISYERTIPDGNDGTGKKLTLFRCTMRSQQKWWFLSEADEEQPGTDKDIDYYQHKSKQHEETEPPPSGWVTCRNAGIDPPPTLKGTGLMVPAGEEHNTLEHQLAKWAIENGIIQLVLGDSMHREVVARSTPLIKFLASMCERDEPVENREPGSNLQGSPGPNAYCLQTAHLLLAWKTCTSKADEAVSFEVYQLLVSILPSLPNGLAIPLLEAILTSLKDTTEKRYYLSEVAEFCSALASANPVDPKSGGAHSGGGPAAPSLSEAVRAEVLQLLWAVLTHPDASSLKSYENLQRYVTNELRVEPKGRFHRETFLESCRRSLSVNAQHRGGAEPVDEALALRMVKLTRFVLEACPREQSIALVCADEGALPKLLFEELVAYLMRRSSASPQLRKQACSSVVSNHVLEDDHPSALSERLRNVRFAFGLSHPVKMNTQQLTELWELCKDPSDREALMVFMADGSNSEHNLGTLGVPEPPPLVAQQNLATSRQVEESHTAAFSDEVRAFAFQELFCSSSVDWNDLGEGAYQSFQTMFKKLRQSTATSLSSSGPALDALWRICLAAGNDAVASQAMKDLLVVYVAMAAVNRTTSTEDRASSEEVNQMQTDFGVENFGNRVFDCLVEVKKGLEHGDPSSERSAERCLRILNAAVGRDGNGGRSITSEAFSSLATVASDGNLTEALESLPHGMRGQSCYRRIGIMAKRTTPHNHAVPVTVSNVSPQSPSPGAAAPPTSRNSSTVRFSLDVHPLETLVSVKEKVASYCQCPVTSVKPISVSGRLAGTGTRSPGGDNSQMSLNVVPDDSLVDQLGIVHGCEMVFVIADRQGQVASSSPSGKNASKKNSTLEMSEIFHDGPNGSADRLFQTLLAVLEALPDPSSQSVDTHKLVWDLLQAIPCNRGIVERVRSTAEMGKSPVTVPDDADSMVLESPRERWSSLLDLNAFHHSVYVMQVIDSFLQPAPEVLSSLPTEKMEVLEKAMQEDAEAFRRGFIDSGGFDAVVRFFSSSDGRQGVRQGKTRMGDAVALRILKCCLFGNSVLGRTVDHDRSSSGLDEAGNQLLQSLSDAGGLLRSLTSMVVDDEGISSSAISDVLKFLRLLFQSPRTTEIFVSLPSGMAEKFLITLLLWEGGPEVSRTSSAVGAASKIRKSTQDLILMVGSLATHSLPWLIRAMDTAVEVTSDATAEYFAVLEQLVKADDIPQATPAHLRDLGTAVCKKLASCPRPTNDSALIDFSTGVLCGCLKLLRALIQSAGGGALSAGASLLLKDLNNVTRWSSSVTSNNRGIFQMISFRSGLRPEDVTLIDLMGAIFDGFLSPGGSSSVVAICCDKESRQLGFEVVAAAAGSCQGSDGYFAMVSRIHDIIVSAAPFLRHRWGHNGGVDEGHSRSLRNTSKYSGLRNQGCTCYMNSVLQQLFMMPGLRKNLCAATIPGCLRTSGGGMFVKGAELLGKKIALQWDSGVSYDAFVEGFDESTGMHTIRYCPMQVATVGGSGHQQVDPEEIARMPREMPDEFFLSEGRPGKETGVFEVVSNGLEYAGDGKSGNAGEKSSEGGKKDLSSCGGITETEDQASSRHLLEEVQRTFIHLDEGSRGRCFDPRALVEACNCLKLEFDVWQQNDASEFAMKLLDRLEISLKRWSPSHFQYLDHTFGLKQTKQKICKECGLKTNREENLMNIDCQIRGKSDIHEALAAMCEVEFMEGDNKVFCDRCKKKTDTVLRTAISALPDMLIVSLKRFDLDYNTFETVKLNSRCSFGQTLDMKRYTLEGVEAMEQANLDDRNGTSPMDTREDDSDALVDDPLSTLPDDDYEYKLVGVLVHAGVAQGGHYYSFIKDRSPGSDAEPDKWYRFDDEDVTPFDPSSIEVECFGGKVKKETKWPNGQVHTVESEQFANALMLFYEKVKPVKHPDEKENGAADDVAEDAIITKTSGYDVFEPDVRRSNATHRWQTFLFDAEFQSFLRGLLELCLVSGNESDRMDVCKAGSSPLPPSGDEDEGSWRTAVVQMLLYFVFDILLYSAEKSSLNFWVNKLSDAVIGNRESAKAFANKLAKKTHTVSANWLRTYLADCPVKDSRVAAVRIFTAAIQSCAGIEEEHAALVRWSQAWKDQNGKERGGLVPLPVKLGGVWQTHEDLDAAGGSGASALGVIISYLAELLEVAPRTWRYTSDLCLFIRELSGLSPVSVEQILREGIIQTHIPPRLVCLAMRDRAPHALKAAFPGASVSLEAVETQIRTETNPSSHVVPASGGQVMNANDMSSRGAAMGSPMASDYLTLFEALGCLLQIPGVKQTELLVESEESARGRQRLVLTRAAADALSVIFQEACSPAATGMGQRDIEVYLQRCGVDSSSVPPQQIMDILTRYSTASGGNGSKGISYLNLDGFLAYYRDTAQSNEARVRSDLHTFGFRPDLTRRSKETRVDNVGGHDHPLQSLESVAIDVAAALKSANTIPASLGALADFAMGQFGFYLYAYSASEALGAHILAAYSYEKDSSPLIVSTLKALHRAPSGWAGNETWSAAVMNLKVLAAIPDSRQQERIMTMMQSTAKFSSPAENELGLLMAAKYYNGSRPSQHYSTDYHYAYDRYLEVIKELFKLRAVALWMSENRPLWSFLERDLVSSQEVAPQHQLSRDFSARREMEDPSAPLDPQHSDSDMHGINDSEDEDDEDSRYDEMETFLARDAKVIVERAGLPVVNGTYESSGTFDRVGKYAKKGMWQDREEEFSLFRCHVSDNTKRWYISIVPKHVQPGTNTDIDFYSAPVIDDMAEYPPLDGWTKAGEGLDPPPTVTWKSDGIGDQEHDNRGVLWNDQIDGSTGGEGGRVFI